MHGNVWQWWRIGSARTTTSNPLRTTPPDPPLAPPVCCAAALVHQLVRPAARRIASSSAPACRVRNGFRVVCQVVASSNQITTFHDATFQQWMQSVAALPAKKQVEAVSRKLVELNPGFDGKLTGFEGKGGPKIDSGAVTELAFDTNNVTDVSPVRALAGLRSLGCRGSFLKGRLSDLSPLRGLQLAKLDCMDNVALSDLSPLAGMPLVYLSCHGTRLSDLSPLRGVPLTSLDCGYSPLSDLSSLKGMRLTFLSVNRTPVSDLSPLEGMPLTSLNCNSCGRIVNLSPLRGMPLTRLDICGSRVTDLSPLEGMPLGSLYSTTTPVSDLSPLQKCKGLANLFSQQPRSPQPASRRCNAGAAQLQDRMGRSGHAGQGRWLAGLCRRKTMNCLCTGAGYFPVRERPVGA